MGDLTQKTTECITRGFNACGADIGSRAHLHESYSLDGIGSATAGAAAGLVAWYVMSGLMLRNYGDSGWRKMLSNVLPVPLALAAGIFMSNMVNDASEKGFSGQTVTQALQETVKTFSSMTGLGQPTVTNAPVTDDWQSMQPKNPLQPRVVPLQP